MVRLLTENTALAVSAACGAAVGPGVGNAVGVGATLGIGVGVAVGPGVGVGNGVGNGVGVGVGVGAAGSGPRLPVPLVLGAAPACCLRGGMAASTMMNRTNTLTIPPIITHKYGGNTSQKDLVTVK